MAYKKGNGINKIENFGWFLFAVSYLIVLLILIPHLIFGLLKIDEYSIALLILLILLSLFPISKSIEIPGVFKVKRQIESLRKELDQKIIQTQNMIVAQSASASVNFIGVDDEKIRDLMRGIPKKKTKEVSKLMAKIDEEFPIEDADSVVALFKVRLILEKRLRELLVKNELLEAQTESIGQMIVTAFKHGLIKPDLSESLRYISFICSRAIHGEKLEEKDATKVLDLAKGVLGRLEELS